MNAKIIDGNLLSKQLRAEVAERAAALTAKGRQPGLAVILVGDSPASQVYVRNKIKACEDNGIHSVFEKYDASMSEAELLARVDALAALVTLLRLDRADRSDFLRYFYRRYEDAPAALLADDVRIDHAGVADARDVGAGLDDDAARIERAFRDAVGGDRAPVVDHRRRGPGGHPHAVGVGLVGLRGDDGLQARAAGMCTLASASIRRR